MALSTEWAMVPMIGLDNFVTVLDGATSRLAITDNGGGFIPLNTLGDGNPVSSTNVDAVGRVGSLKTAFKLMAAFAQANLVIDGVYNITFSLMIPPGVQGLVAQGFSSAQLNDTANYPIFDVSMFDPLCFATPSRSLITGSQGEGQGSFPISSQSECWGEDLGFTLGLERYTPPQFYSAFTPTIDTSVPAGQYGIATFLLCITPSLFMVTDPNTGVTVQPDSTLQVVIDFSWTAGN